MRRLLHSVRFQLILLVMLGALAASVISFLHAYRDIRKDRDLADKELVAHLSLIRKDCEGVILATKQLLVALSGTRRLDLADPRGCEVALKALTGIFPMYAALGVLDPKGTSVCHTGPRDRVLSVADRPWFQEALQSKGFVISGYVLGRLTGRPVRVVSYPVVGTGGEVLAVMFAGVDLGWMERYLASYRIEPNWEYIVVDKEGTILARWPEGERWRGERFAGSLVLNA